MSSTSAESPDLSGLESPQSSTNEGEQLSISEEGNASILEGEQVSVSEEENASNSDEENASNSEEEDSLVHEPALQPLREFYIFSVWHWKPKGAEKILESMSLLDCEGAEITFEPDTQFFKVICAPEDEVEIMKQFKTAQEEIEDEILKMNAYHFLNPNGTINKSLVTELFSFRPEHTLVKRVGNSNKEYALPAAASKYKYHDVWAQLDVDTESMTARKVLDGDKLSTLEKRNNVDLTYSITGKAVYIFGHTPAAVEETVKVLDFLAEAAKVKDPVSTHVFYAEGYVDPCYSTFSADARYIANINPALLSTTLLDRRAFTGPERPYATLARAISLRLCRYDEQKLYHVPLLGPEISPLNHSSTEESGKPGTARPPPFALNRKVRGQKRPGPKTRVWIAGPDPIFERTPSPAGNLVECHAIEKARALRKQEEEASSIEKWLITTSTSGDNLLNAANSSSASPARQASLTHKMNELTARMAALNVKQPRTPADQEEMHAILDEMKSIADKIAVTGQLQEQTEQPAKTDVPVSSGPSAQDTKAADREQDEDRQMWSDPEDAPIIIGPSRDTQRPFQPPLQHAAIANQKEITIQKQTGEQVVPEPAKSTNTPVQAPRNVNHPAKSVVPMAPKKKALDTKSDVDFEGSDFNGDDIYPREYLKKLRAAATGPDNSNPGEPASPLLIDFGEAVTVESKPTTFASISFGMAPLVAESMSCGNASSSMAGATVKDLLDGLPEESAPSEDGQYADLLTESYIPDSVSGSTKQGLKPMLETTMEGDTAMEYSDEDKDTQGTVEDVGAKDSVEDDARSKTSTKAANRSDGGGQIKHTTPFDRELEDAFKQLVAKARYLPGKITLQAEFCRILLREIDESGLAFNPEGTKSSGWPQEILKKCLHESKHTTFTKILTRDGRDAEYMARIRDVKNARLWNLLPSSRTVYSFTCVAGRDKTKRELFYVDVDGTDENFTYELRGANDNKDPIWVDNLVRNWDLRVVLSHSDVASLERKFGAFAKSLVANLQADTNGGGWEGARLRWGIHKHFAVAVNNVRTLTKWRFDSRVGENGNGTCIGNPAVSHLVITEVVENEIGPCKASPGMSSRGDWFLQMAQPLREHERARQERLGFPDRWYEASIESGAAQKLFRQNGKMDIGEKAEWDFESLRAAGVIDAIFKPALRMLMEMDSVGARNDNRQVQAMALPRPNDAVRDGADKGTSSGRFW